MGLFYFIFIWFEYIFIVYVIAIVYDSVHGQYILNFNLTWLNLVNPACYQETKKPNAVYSEDFPRSENVAEQTAAPQTVKKWRCRKFLSISPQMRRETLRALCLRFSDSEPHFWPEWLVRSFCIVLIRSFTHGERILYSLPQRCAWLFNHWL